MTSVSGHEQRRGGDSRTRSVVLTGFMATGKSTVGRQLAARLRYGFVDTDRLIEERFGSIPEIFRTQGEERFRAIERELASEIAALPALVIATGGGMLVDSAVADVFTGGIAGQARQVFSDMTGQDILNISVMKTHGRKQESEADYMGLAFCAMSGYDLNESVRLWKRMNEKNKGKEIPQFLSTHPSSVTRILQIRGWIPEIKSKFPYSL